MPIAPQNRRNWHTADILNVCLLDFATDNSPLACPMGNIPGCAVTGFSISFHGSWSSIPHEAAFSKIFPSLHCIPIPRSVLFYGLPLLHGTRKVDLFYVAFIKFSISNACDTGTDYNARQAPAVVECVMCNAGNPLRHHDIIQTFAARERTVSNALKVISERGTAQAAARTEGVSSDA